MVILSPLLNIFSTLISNADDNVLCAHNKVKKVDAHNAILKFFIRPKFCLKVTHVKGSYYIYCSNKDNTNGSVKQYVHQSGVAYMKAKQRQAIIYDLYKTMR